ncbi:MAG: biosynthetic-type acetolactate synthase large subunit [Flavobacteriales bacterium Tduv]
MKKEIFTGSEILIKSLLEEEVEYIFGYPGGAIMPIYDAIHHYQDEISHILTRHEQGAIHAAQGYARVTGKVGVCFTTSGPGATNLITGLVDALIDNTPLVCITGQVPSYLLGTDAFQETNIMDLSISATKWNAQVTDVRDLCKVIRQAFYIAKSGRPGPVLVDITKNAQFQTAYFNYSFCTSVNNFTPYPKVEERGVQAAAQLIDASEKPLAIIGQGVILAHAEKELKYFIEKTGIPVASTLLGLGAIENSHPLHVGMVGMHGNYAPNILTNECDALIAIGMRFDDRVTGDVKRYAKQARVIHLEIDPCEIGKNIPCDVPILGDCKISLPKLTDRVQKNNHQAWICSFDKLRAEEEENVMRNDLHPTKKGLTMGEAIRWINHYKQDNAILVTDVGQHQMITSRYFDFTVSKTQITSGGLGTMGFALPAAIGAQLGAKDRQVICVAGDGGIQMTLQELGSILQYDIPIKIVLLNNNFLGMVRQWQQLFFDKRYSCTELVNPDFVQLANAYNISGKKVERRENLAAAVEKMFDHKGPYLLEVVVEREDNVFPMITSGAAVNEIRLT